MMTDEEWEFNLVRVCQHSGLALFATRWRMVLQELREENKKLSARVTQLEAAINALHNMEDHS